MQLIAIGAAESRVPSGTARGAASGNGIAFAGALKAHAKLTVGQTDPLAQMAQQIAAQLAAALAQAAGGMDTQQQLTLQRALAGALAPPGESPGSGEQEAAALKQRLTAILTALTRGKNEGPGQQNEIAGNILDADSAKEIPAQPSKDQNGAPRAATALDTIVQRLLAQAAQAALGAQTVAPPASPATPQAPSASQQQPPPTGASLQQLAAALTGSAAPASSIAALPDVLSRMLARAASAAPASDAEHAPPAQTVAAAGATSSQAKSAPLAPQTIFARLMSTIAQVERETTGSGAHAQNDGSAWQQRDGAASADLTQRQLIPRAGSANSAANAPAFSVQSGAPASIQTSSQTSQTPQPYTSIDPQSIVEQMVSGIVLRNAGTTSELRLTLQPAHLGDLTLKLTVSGNAVNANVIAQSAAVRDVLLANQQQLARSLAQSGLTLGKFSAGVAGGDAGTQQQQQPFKQGRPAAAGGSLLALSGTPEEEDRYGPPIRSASGSVVFNYFV